MIFKEICGISNLVAIMQLKTRGRNITKLDANCDFYGITSVRDKI
ncbi:hypothetical protein [Rickettsia endosymbiont of Oedothorax gibbosus]|nr:hypothetical protein [Rickettsia endosymbiont of Oedothorax gibbosus]